MYFSVNTENELLSIVFDGVIASLLLSHLSGVVFTSQSSDELKLLLWIQRAVMGEKKLPSHYMLMLILDPAQVVDLREAIRDNR
jgi:hypothetical protein